jgi:hypothetical protein
MPQDYAVVRLVDRLAIYLASTSHQDRLVDAMLNERIWKQKLPWSPEAVPKVSKPRGNELRIQLCLPFFPSTRLEQPSLT